MKYFQGLKAISCLRNSKFSTLYYEMLLKEKNIENTFNDFKRRQFEWQLFLKIFIITRTIFFSTTALSLWDAHEADETKNVLKENVKGLLWNFQSSLENIETSALYNWLEHSSLNMQNFRFFILFYKKLKLLFNLFY